MVEEVLQAIKRHGALDISRIARDLGASPEAVREAIRLLEEQGYLEAVEMKPPRGLFCRFCPLRKKCGEETVGLKLYRISAKGQRLLAGGKGS